MNDLTSTQEAPLERSGITLHNEVLSRLRDHVTHGGIPEGHRLSERELCEKFGISRTPLREVLKVLASEGLIELLPNRGARVKTLTPDEIGELFDLMGGLEALAGRLACERISEEKFDLIEQTHRDMYLHYLRGDRQGYFTCNQTIHETILAAAGNEALSAAAHSLLCRLRRVRYTANLDKQDERWREAVREHELILDALRRRAGPELADLLFGHLRRTKSAVLRNLGTHPA